MRKNRDPLKKSKSHQHKCPTESLPTHFLFFRGTLQTRKKPKRPRDRKTSQKKKRPQNAGRRVFGSPLAKNAWKKEGGRRKKHQKRPKYHQKYETKTEERGAENLFFKNCESSPVAQLAFFPKPPRARDPGAATARTHRPEKTGLQFECEKNTKNIIAAVTKTKLDCLNVKKILPQSYF